MWGILKYPFWNPKHPFFILFSQYLWTSPETHSSRYSVDISEIGFLLPIWGQWKKKTVYNSFTSHPSETKTLCIEFFRYCARRLIWSRIIESEIGAPFIPKSTQQMSINWIIRLLLSLSSWPKVILLSGGHCNYSGTGLL